MELLKHLVLGCGNSRMEACPGFVRRFPSTLCLESSYGIPRCRLQEEATHVGGDVCYSAYSAPGEGQPWDTWGLFISDHRSETKFAEKFGL